MINALLLSKQFSRQDPLRRVRLALFCGRFQNVSSFMGKNSQSGDFAFLKRIGFNALKRLHHIVILPFSGGISFGKNAQILLQRLIALFPEPTTLPTSCCHNILLSDFASNRPTFQLHTLDQNPVVSESC